MKKIIFGMVVALLMVGCGSDGGDTYVTEEAPLPPATPSNGTAIVVEATDNSSVGVSYTQVDGGVYIEANDGSQVTVYEATKVEDEDDNETEEE